jgi:hypothetical protein
MNSFHWVTMVVLAMWTLAKIAHRYKSPAERKSIADDRRRCDEHNEKMNQHYRRMNTFYGRSYEKIDEGWWSEDVTLLSKYAGLVARWKPGGDLFRNEIGTTG